MVLNHYSLHLNHLGGFLKHRLLCHRHRASDSGGLGWGLRTCIFNKFISGIWGQVLLVWKDLWKITDGASLHQWRTVYGSKLLGLPVTVHIPICSSSIFIHDSKLNSSIRPLHWHEPHTGIHEISSRGPGASRQSKPGLTQCTGHRESSINGDREWKLERQQSKACLENQLKWKVSGTDRSFLSQLFTGKEGPWDHNEPTIPSPEAAAFPLSGPFILGLQPQWVLPRFEGKGASISGLSLALAPPRASSLLLGDAECSQGQGCNQ